MGSASLGPSWGCQWVSPSQPVLGRKEGRSPVLCRAGCPGQDMTTARLPAPWWVGRETPRDGGRGIALPVVTGEQHHWVELAACLHFVAWEMGKKAGRERGMRKMCREAIEGARKSRKITRRGRERRRKKRELLRSDSPCATPTCPNNVRPSVDASECLTRPSRRKGGVGSASRQMPSSQRSAAEWPSSQVWGTGMKGWEGLGPAKDSTGHQGSLRLSSSHLKDIRGNCSPWGCKESDTTEQQHLNPICQECYRIIIHEMLCALVPTKSLKCIFGASSTSQFRSAELQVLSHHKGKGYWFLRFFFFDVGHL